MNRLLRSLLMALLVAGLWAPAATAQPAVGQPAPALNVSQWLNGDGPMTLAEMRGKVLLIEFWATW